jgi:hypothetical protein
MENMPFNTRRGELCSPVPPSGLNHASLIYDSPIGKLLLQEDDGFITGLYFAADDELTFPSVIPYTNATLAL